MAYRTGEIQQLQTRTVVVPMEGILQQHAETLQWLDQYTPSSFALLGHLVADTYLGWGRHRPTFSEFSRAFWNLFESAQIGIKNPDEIPDRHYDALEGIAVGTIMLIEALKAEDFQAFGDYPVGASACLLPSYGYNLYMQISFPARVKL